MKARYALLCAALSAAIAAPAAAQTCVGMPSFAVAPMRGDVGVNFGDNATSFGAGLNFGQAKGLFGGVNFGLTDIDGTDTNVKSIGAQGGYSITPATNPKLGLCPIVSLDYSWVSVLGETVSTTTVGLGGAVGGILSQGPTATIVPTAGLAVLIPSGDAAGDTYGNLRLGVGFHFKRNTISLLPAVDVPLGVEGADARFGVTFGFMFGSR